MEKNLQLHLQELLFGSADPVVSRKLSAWEEEGKIKKIAPRIYTGKIHEAPETVIRRNIFTILGKQYPRAVLSHRSALEFKPTASGTLFLTYTYTRKIQLPGITLRILEGPGPVDGDRHFFGDLYVSQQARAFLENMQLSRKAGPDSKTLSQAEIEERLERIVQVNGEQALNQLRDDARKLATPLGMEAEFKKLNTIISALLSTYSSKVLTSDAARARVEGIPFDAGRMKIFETLFIALKQEEFKRRPDCNGTDRSFANFAFFESYFSNYIEGTVFELEEALEIIDTQRPLPSRNEDSHDILGTYQLVSNPQEMRVVPKSGNHLLEILQYRHQILLSARESKQPGVFKDRNNYAGQTMFVEHHLVKGTLLRAYEYYQVLDPGFVRAVFMMFLISEVHPFLDGNGRLARVMLNAELVSAGESKIMIPTVYREDYIGALRKLTRQQDPSVFIQMMERVHAFSANVYGEDREQMRAYLESCNAFWEDTEGRVLKIAPREA